MTNDKSNINILFGRNVKHYRKKKRLTQELLGELVGVSTKYIGNIECGVSFPSSSIISQLSVVLEIPTYLLFVPEETIIDSPFDSYVSKDVLKKELSKKFKLLLEEL